MWLPAQIAAAPVAPTYEIFEIQGDGANSPLNGDVVATLDNVVTAVGPDGFTIQTPDARDDGDPNTSNGLLVFTDAAPTVAVGDQVDVTGKVIEFFDLTEIVGPLTVVVDSSGNPLPAAVPFDAATPSPDPPQSAVEFERFEGMRVAITSGVVCGPNQTFDSDPIAEVFITAASERCFRGPGIKFPRSDGDLPTWDGNPEVFELDPDRLGLPNQAIPAGSIFAAEGVIGYEFGGYELWPTSLTVDPLSLPRPVRSRNADEFTVGSLNLFRLFDAHDDPPGSRGRDDTVVSAAEYNTRRAKLADYILNVLRAPDILGVQEAEKIEVLQDLAAEIHTLDASVSYTAYLEEGNDIGTMDVGFLVRDTVSVRAVTQLGADEVLTLDGSPLHDRPPLLLEADADLISIDSGTPSPIAVIVNHTRSLGGIDDLFDGDRVQQKRLEQAQSIAQKVQDFQTANPTTPLVLIGDYNAFQFTDGYVDVIGQIAGDVDPVENTLSGPDLVEPNLTRQVLRLPAEERYSFIFHGNAEALDHALTSAAGDPLVRGFEYGRGNADAAEHLINDGSTPLASSDHDGFVLFLERQTEPVGDYTGLTIWPWVALSIAVVMGAIGLMLLKQRTA